MKHGTRTCYVMWQCRCNRCKAANTAYLTLYKKRNAKSIAAYERRRQEARKAS